MQLKLDPVAYVLLLGILAVQIYTSFVRSSDTEDLIEANDELYQRAVFDDPENNGVMHQVFRQNELNRELLKAALARCAP